MRKPRENLDQGFSLIEIVVGVSVLLALFLGTAQHYETSALASRASIQETQADYLAEEGIEAVKLLRAESWSEKIAPLQTDDSYGLSYENDAWKAVATPETVGSFSRSFVLEEVYRGSDDDILESGTSGGTLDPGTKKLTVSITWQGASGTSTKELTTYMTDLYND